jgi:hypothetical protein
MIKLKNIMLEIYKGSLPHFLYHGTFYPLVQSIQIRGLVPGGTVGQNFSSYGKDGVFLTNKKDLAKDFVLDSNNRKFVDMWKGDLAILTIDIEKIDNKKLFEIDPNFGIIKKPLTAREPRQYPTISFKYKGVIPPSAIVNVERLI